SVLWSPFMFFRSLLSTSFPEESSTLMLLYRMSIGSLKYTLIVDGGEVTELPSSGTLLTMNACAYDLGIAGNATRTAAKRIDERIIPAESLGIENRRPELTSMIWSARYLTFAKILVQLSNIGIL